MKAEQERIKADQARIKLEQSVLCELDGVYTSIEFAANQSLSSTTIDLTAKPILANNIDFVIKTLKDDGYTVKHSTGSDPRDYYASWSNLTINW